MLDISVCIPVYGTERYLKKCLESVATQTFTNYEIILVNDGSTGVDDAGLNCKKIVKECKKKLKLPIKYIEHSRNLGALEARRHAVEESSGEYIFTLDSDDYLPPDSLEILYKQAKLTGADIVHGMMVTKNVENPVELAVETQKQIDERQKNFQKRVSLIYDGVLEGRDIFDGFFLEEKYCGFLAGKLIKKNDFMLAFSHIPEMFCVMADDLILFFWISYFAKKYVSVKKNIYYYNINTGITSCRIINDLVSWSHVCSAASVFAGIFEELRIIKLDLTREEADRLTYLCYYYVGNNLKQLKRLVAPEIKNEAYSLLCDYWGNDLVQQVEQKMKSKGLL